MLGDISTSYQACLATGGQKFKTLLWIELS